VQELPIILRDVPTRRQTLLFSATMTKNLTKLGQLSLNKPFRYDTTVNFETVATLRQEYLFMPQTVKDCYLAFVLDQFVQTSDKTASCVVFVANKVICELLSEMLNELTLPVVSLHSQKSQQKRSEAIALFKSGVKRIMIATDLASRGLDIGHVALVVNHNIPRSYRDYLHRVGRTARKGRQGRALSLVSQYEVTLLQYIETKLGTALAEYPHEEKQVLKYLNPALKAFQVARLRLDESGFFERHHELKQRRLEQRREQAASGTAPPADWSDEEDLPALDGHVIGDVALDTPLAALAESRDRMAVHRSGEVSKKRKRADDTASARQNKVSKTGSAKVSKANSEQNNTLTRPANRQQKKKNSPIKKFKPTRK
jgi:superfamily II DNA/RNA helicase